MRRAVVVSDDSSSDGGSDDGVARQHESDASESSEDDASAGRGGLIDVEAEESGDDSEEDESESETEDGRDDGSLRSFHGFTQLPLELRYRIWETFCPDLTARGRLLQFDLWARDISRQGRALSRQRVWTVKEWVTLQDQTEPLRRVMAVHRESRTMALKAFPETLSMDSGLGDALVHFNRRDDVVTFNGTQRHDPSDRHHLPGFADRVLKVAVPKWKSPNDDLALELVRKFAGDFPNLERIYFHQDERVHKDRDIRWCVSDYAHQYLTETFEKQPGLGENTQAVACWPDVDNHPDFAKYQIPRLHLEGRPPGIDEMLEERSIEAWPMVLFEFEQAMARYQWLHETKHIPNCEELVSGFYDPSSGTEHSESETEEDEYESEGIDDAEIIDDDDDEESEDEIIPPALSDADSSADDGNAAGARFSSPEPDDEDEEGEGDEPEPAPRPPKRRIVTDSDDDDDAEPDEPRAKRARTGRVIMVDSDDEDDAAPATAPVVTISDSDDDDDVGGAKTAATHDESSSSGDDSDGDDAGGPPKQRMSLAERLRMSREAIPIPSSDGEDDEEHDEEDEDDEEDDEDADDSGDGLIDGMAAESDDEEDEEESEDGW